MLSREWQRERESQADSALSVMSEEGLDLRTLRSQLRDHDQAETKSWMLNQLQDTSILIYFFLVIIQKPQHASLLYQSLINTLHLLLANIRTLEYLKYIHNPSDLHASVAEWRWGGALFGKVWTLENSNIVPFVT